jgi:hypothetical protein
MSFAPAVAQSPIGPCAKTTTASPIRTRPASAPCDVGAKDHLLVAQLRGDLREVRLRRRNEQIFRLRAVDRVAEAPAADRRVALAAAAL